MDNAFYEKTFELYTDDVDFMQRMKPCAVLDIFQEIAGAHAEELNVGFQAMAERNLFWVLSRVKFEIVHMPKYRQRLRVKTWPIKPGAVYFERDFIYYNEIGEVMVRGSSIWCVLDRKTHVLLPAKSLNLFFEVNFLEQRALSDKIGKISAGLIVMDQKNRHTYPSELDFNQHINNIRYAEFAVDCFSFDYLKQHSVKTMQIHYLKEGHCDAELKLTISEKASDTYFIDGKVGDENVFCSQIAFD